MENYKIISISDNEVFIQLKNGDFQSRLPYTGFVSLMQDECKELYEKCIKELGYEATPSMICEWFYKHNDDSKVYIPSEHTNIPEYYVCEQMQTLRDYLDHIGIEWDDVSDMSELWVCRTHFDYNGHHISVIHGFGTYGGFSYSNCDTKLLEMSLDYCEPIGDISWTRAINILQKEYGKWKGEK